MLGLAGAVGWCTAQVFIGLSRLRRLLRTLISSSILAEFNGQAASKSSNQRDWSNLMDADLELAGETTSLKEELFTRLLKPLACKEGTLMRQLKEPFSEVGSSPAPLYSAILFGPPGQN